MDKSKKVIAGIIIGIGIIGGAGLTYGQHVEKVRAEKAQHEGELHNQQLIRAAQEEVANLYNNEKKESLAEDISTTKIDDAVLKVKKVKDTKIKNSLLKEIDDIRTLFDTKTTVKGLLHNGIIVDNVDKAKINSMDAIFIEAKEINEHIATSFSHDVKEIHSQFELIKKANKQVLSLFTDEKGTKVNEKVTKGQYNEGKKSTSQIKNKKIRAELEKLLNKVAIALEKIEEKKQRQQENKNEQQVANKTTTSATTSTTNSTSATTNTTSSSKSNAQGSTSRTKKEQTGFAGIVSKSKTAQNTDQIVTVVASGTSAQVSLFEKNDGSWSEVIKTTGHVGSMGVGNASEYVSRTPRGNYRLGFAFGTSNPGTQLPFRKITPNSY